MRGIDAVSPLVNMLAARERRERLATEAAEKEERDRIDTINAERDAITTGGGVNVASIWLDPDKYSETYRDSYFKALGAKRAGEFISLTGQEFAQRKQSFASVDEVDTWYAARTAEFFGQTDNSAFVEGSIRTLSNARSELMRQYTGFRQGAVQEEARENWQSGMVAEVALLWNKPDQLAAAFQRHREEGAKLGLDSADVDRAILQISSNLAETRKSNVPLQALYGVKGAGGMAFTDDPDNSANVQNAMRRVDSIRKAEQAKIDAERKDAQQREVTKRLLLGDHLGALNQTVALWEKGDATNAQVLQVSEIYRKVLEKEQGAADKFKAVGNGLGQYLRREDRDDIITAFGAIAARGAEEDGQPPEAVAAAFTNQVLSVAARNNSVYGPYATAVQAGAISRDPREFGEGLRLFQHMKKQLSPTQVAAYIDPKAQVSYELFETLVNRGADPDEALVTIQSNLANFQTVWADLEKKGAPNSTVLTLGDQVTAVVNEIVGENPVFVSPLIRDEVKQTAMYELALGYNTGVTDPPQAIARAKEKVAARYHRTEAGALIPRAALTAFGNDFNAIEGLLSRDASELPVHPDGHEWPTIANVIAGRDDLPSRDPDDYVLWFEQDTQQFSVRHRDGGGKAFTFAEGALEGVYGSFRAATNIEAAKVHAAEKRVAVEGFAFRKYVDFYTKYFSSPGMSEEARAEARRYIQQGKAPPDWLGGYATWERLQAMDENQQAAELRRLYDASSNAGFTPQP